MTRNHLGTVVLALATITLAPPWPHAAMAQTRLTVAGGLNLATVDSGRGGLDPGIGHPAGNRGQRRNPDVGEVGTSPRCRLLPEGLRSISAFGVSVTTEIDYLEVTALAGIPFSVSERASVHLLAGPALAFKLSCQASATFLGEDLSEDCGDDGPKAMDLGLVGGARLEFGVSDKMGVSVGALYNFGLLNMDDSGSDETVKNRVMSLQAGIVYSIG